MELHHANELAARSLAYFDKTLVLLTGDRPGFDRDHAIAIVRFLQENGFYVYECCCFRMRSLYRRNSHRQ